MTNDKDMIPELPEALRTAARDYNKPPELARADLDAMWSAIEREAFRSDIGGRVTADDSALKRAARRWMASSTLLPIAATLIIGVAIGRVSARPSNASTTGVVTASMTRTDTMGLAEPYQSTTSRYLGQTAALLVALPAEARAGRADERFVGRAQDLLLTTRLLLDSPASDDTRIRTLLEDLELVLAQIVRLQTNKPQQGLSELDLIRQALEQRDVLPRLRTAAANIAADN